jgi:hypothetical protein
MCVELLEVKEQEKNNKNSTFYVYQTLGPKVKYALGDCGQKIAIGNPPRVDED